MKKLCGIFRNVLLSLALCGLIVSNGYLAHASTVDDERHTHANFVSADHDHTQSDDIDADGVSGMHCGSGNFTLPEYFSDVDFGPRTLRTNFISTRFIERDGLVDPPPPRPLPIHI